jgi:hypothetical protein
MYTRVNDKCNLYIAGIFNGLWGSSVVLNYISRKAEQKNI